MYTPALVVENETRRQIFVWFSRFDIFASMMAGRKTTVSVDWSIAIENWHYYAREMDPTSVDLQIRWLVAYRRVLAFRLAEIFSNLQKGEMSQATFADAYHGIMEQLRGWATHLAPLMELTEDKLPLPVLPGHSEKWVEGIPRAEYLYLGSGWGVNFLLLDLYSSLALQKYQYAKMMGLSKPIDAEILAKESCRTVEAMDTNPQSPEGSILQCQAAIGLLTMFLPSGQEYSNWCRGKMMRIEDLGYVSGYCLLFTPNFPCQMRFVLQCLYRVREIDQVRAYSYCYPPVIRNRLAQQWNQPEIKDWWLPDWEGIRPIIKSIHDFNKERESQPQDKDGKDVREMRGLFNNMVLGVSGPKQDPIPGRS